MLYGSLPFIRLQWIDLTLNRTASRDPTPTDRYNRINVGDVGFIRWGRFNLLFSASCSLGLGGRRPGFDVPLTFEELHVGDPQHRQPLPPVPLYTETVRKIEAGAGASVSVGLCVRLSESPSHS